MQNLSEALELAREHNVHLEQYLGVWAMEPGQFEQLRSMLRETDIVAHVRDSAQAAPLADPRGPGADKTQVADGVAVIDLHGTMTKHGSSFSDMRYGTVGVRRQIRTAAEDDKVKAIMLHVDSPGGSTKGVDDLAADVRMAAKSKPVFAFIEDIGASAAYFVASQATRIVAAPSAFVGSIGTYMVVDDWSGFFADAKVKRWVIRAGEMKGAGVQGTEITEAQREDFQRTVNEMNDLFISAVKSGRKLNAKQVKAVADGRVHVAAAAQELGLIDAVSTYDAAIQELKQTANVSRTRPAATTSAAQKRREIVMSDETTTQAGGDQAQGAASPPAPPAPATYDQLAAMTGADEKFICTQLAAKATVEQAQKALTKAQADRIAALEAQNKELAEKAEAAQAKKPGVPAVSGTQSADAEPSINAVEVFEAAFAQNLERFKGDRKRAMSKTVNDDPDRHRAYLESVNAA